MSHYDDCSDVGLYLDSKQLVQNAAGGKKNDMGKQLASLVQIGCPRALQEATAIMTLGANKYGKFNWKHVETYRYWDAFYRHLSEYHTDPASLDHDSGRSHLSHALTNLMFIIELELK